jgi:hypothetical protein
VAVRCRQVKDLRYMSMGPVVVYGPAGPTGANSRGSCGIDSVGRGAKIVFEVGR